MSLVKYVLVFNVIRRKTLIVIDIIALVLVLDNIFRNGMVDRLEMYISSFLLPMDHLYLDNNSIHCHNDALIDGISFKSTFAQQFRK